MFVTSLVFLVMAFLFWSMFLTVKAIGKNRPPVTPEIAAGALFLVSVLIGSLTTAYLLTDPASIRFYLLPAAGLLIGSAIGVILKVGQIRKPLTSGVALVDVMLYLSAIVFLAAFLVSR